MRGERGRGRRWTAAGLTAVVTIILVVILAAPAFAEPAATTWTVSPKSGTVTYGDAVFLSGTLKSEGVAIPALWVDFGQGTTSAGSFEIVYKITTPAGSTKYAVGVKPLQNMYYRFQWAGDTTYAPKDSDLIPVQVAPAIAAPTNGSAISVNKKFSVKGTVEPGAPDGPAVKIKAYRQKGDGSWAGYKTYSAEVSGTQYSLSLAISQTGKFKFKAVSADSAEYAAGVSGFGKVITIKAVATL